MPDLSECKLITGEEYMKLKDPRFVGQTRVDKETSGYYMVWEQDGVYYKTYNVQERYSSRKK